MDFLDKKVDIFEKSINFLIHWIFLKNEASLRSGGPSPPARPAGAPSEQLPLYPRNQNPRAASVRHILVVRGAVLMEYLKYPFQQSYKNWNFKYPLISQNFAMLFNFSEKAWSKINESRCPNISNQLSVAFFSIRTAQNKYLILYIRLPSLIEIEICDEIENSNSV